MPELTLEVGGRIYEVACEPGQERSLERAAALLDAEALRLTDEMGRSVEKRMLLLAGLMLGDAMAAVESRLTETEEQLRAADERIRIAEAKAAMLAANSLKGGGDGRSSVVVGNEGGEDQALDLLGRVLEEVERLAEVAAPR